MAAARHPVRFRSLWLYDPAIVPGRSFPADVPNPLAEGALRRREAFASLEAAVQHYARRPPLDALHPDALEAYVHGGFAQEGGRVVLRCRPSTEAAVFRGAAGSGAWQALAEVHLPAAVVVGRIEPLSPASFASRIADELGNGVLAERPDLGHFGPLEAPASVAADIADWVSEHAGA
jgi:pimeloyl-ACP methyl ester carboxylesterase